QDYKLLDDGQWLNDTIIEFFYEWLEHHQKGTRTKSLAESFAYVRPAIVHLLAHTSDVGFLESVLEGLRLKTKQVIFIPVNDNESDSAGGGHWSLLVYYRPTNAFYYYDSMGKYNLAVAKRTKKKLEELICLPEPILVEIDTPAQINGYDCGVYVITITEVLSGRMTDRHGAELTEKPGDLSGWRLSHSITPEGVRDKRRQIQQLISDT
ncbi:hypothetical protein BC829DRAFT_360984, partial [Chytridium lagenaria]